MSFEANRGQFDRRVQYLSRGPGYSVLVMSGSIELQLSGANYRAADPLSMHLVGASTAGRVAGTRRLPGVANYYVGAERSDWRSGIPTYAAVQQRNVYAGIDVVYYGNQSHLEYDFIVAPGADPDSIRLAFEGAERLEVAKNGDLLLHTPRGILRQHRPVLYQQSGSRRTDVKGGYFLMASREVGFRVGSYDRRRPLVIDPVLSYSTFTGGAGADSANSVTLDANGNAYLVGTTNSGFNNRNAFVQKVNAAGSAVLYTSFIGDVCDDSGTSIAVDGNGNAYVTGRVILLGQFGYCTDKKVFVSKLSPTGAQVYGVTFGSDAGDDFGYDIAVDAFGNAYVTGQASFAGFPTTVGSFQPEGYSGAFVSKLNAAGNAFVYSTYLGNTITIGYGIAVDTQGNAYVSGWTQDSSFPTTASAAQRTFAAGGTVQAFATKLNASGSALLYSTLLGGNIADHANELAIDAQGNMYITGNTESDNFPTTAGAPDRTCGTDGMCNMAYVCGLTCRFERLSDAFVAKINPALTGAASLVFSTYLGGANKEQGRGIAVGANGTVWATGVTYSSALTFPVVGAIQGQLAGTSDAYVAQLNSTGTGLLFSTYLGGGGEDDGAGIVTDTQGNAYVVGVTPSPDFPRLNPFQSTFGGGGADAFLAKISVGATASALASLSVNPTSVSAGATSTGTVTLTAAAPAGGATITLLSSNTNAATTPVSVLIAAGGTSATFTITTKTVTAATNASISAAYSGVTKTAALTVNPLAVLLESVTLSPTTVTGGKTSSATVKLTAAAPAGGLMVNLTSSNTAVATVPASVTVPAGATTAKATVTSGVLGAQQVATITATAGGVNRTAALTVVPAALSLVSATPSPITGSKNATGKVTLTGAAPAGGIVVTLASSNAAIAATPASVTVAAGASAATFTITTKVVTADAAVMISGAYSGVTKTATLTVIPAVLANLTVAAHPVCGCKPTTAAVTLTGAAPTGGATVMLSEMHPNATLPVSVVVPAGATNATFTISTTAVSTSQVGTVTAAYGGVARNVNLTVRPIGVASVSLTPNPVIGPAAVTGTATLECPAAPAGIAVTLASNQSATASPAVPSITIPAGASSGTFRVNTTDVSVVTSATITATAPGKAASRVLTVNP